MVSPVLDKIEELADLLSETDEDISAQGWEILSCLDASVRWQVASLLITPPHSAWRLATRCLFPEPMATMRLARFRVRCAQLRLLLLRSQGIELAAWAWEAVDMAEQRAAGRLPERRYQRLLRETEHLRERWYYDWPAEELGEQMIDLDQIPSDWPARCDEAGAVLDIDPIRSAPEQQGLADTWEATDRTGAAEYAVAMSLLDEGIDEWGEEIETIPQPESVAEWALQRRLWEAIMLRSEDGIDVLCDLPSNDRAGAARAEVGRPPRHRSRRQRDWARLSWG